MLQHVKLVVVSGEVKTTEITLKLPAIIGRGRDAAVVLPHPLVSRHHCELFEDDGLLTVKDLESLNGTFVNNERITEATLAPGELLTIGTVTFRAVYQAPGGDDDEGRTMSIPKTSDKTVKLNKAATSKAPAKAKSSADSDEAPLDANLRKPLFSSDDIDDQSPGGPGRVTERINVPADKGKSAAPTSGSKPVKKLPLLPEGVDEEEGKLSSSSDDGLDDFLKDLKK
jgi:predicted component of type VI protein secretion system